MCTIGRPEPFPGVSLQGAVQHEAVPVLPGRARVRPRPVLGVRGRRAAPAPPRAPRRARPPATGLLQERLRAEVHRYFQFLIIIQRGRCSQASQSPRNFSTLSRKMLKTNLNFRICSHILADLDT